MNSQCIGTQGRHYILYALRRGDFDAGGCLFKSTPKDICLLRHCVCMRAYELSRQQHRITCFFIVASFEIPFCKIETNKVEIYFRKMRSNCPRGFCIQKISSGSHH